MPLPCHGLFRDIRGEMKPALPDSALIYAKPRKGKRVNYLTQLRLQT